jgi:hypothetical protein
VSEGNQQQQNQQGQNQQGQGGGPLGGVTEQAGQAVEGVQETPRARRRTPQERPSIGSAR